MNTVVRSIQGVYGTLIDQHGRRTPLGPPTAIAIRGNSFSFDFVVPREQWEFITRKGALLVTELGSQQTTRNLEPIALPLDDENDTVTLVQRIDVML